MEPYVWKRRPDGIHIINIGKTWQKLVLAARIIATIENPADVVVVSARPYGQRAVLKFAAHVGATAVAGRFTPGAFTNYNSRSFKVVSSDPLCRRLSDLFFFFSFSFLFSLLFFSILFLFSSIDFLSPALLLQRTHEQTTKL